MAFVDEGVRTFPVTAATAIKRYARVVLSSGSLIEADATAKGLGVAKEAVPSSGWRSGEPIAVMLWNKPGTLPMIASAAITAGVPVFAAAAGKIAATGTIQVGRALEAATADGDIIEVLPINQSV